MNETKRSPGSVRKQILPCGRVHSTRGGSPQLNYKGIMLRKTHAARHRCISIGGTRSSSRSSILAFVLWSAVLSIVVVVVVMLVVSF